MQNLPLSYKLPITYAAAFLHPIRNPKCAQIIMCVMGEKRLQGNFHFSVGIVCILFTRKNNNTHNLYWLQPIFISCVYYVSSVLSNFIQTFMHVCVQLQCGISCIERGNVGNYSHVNLLLALAFSCVLFLIFEKKI